MRAAALPAQGGCEPDTLRKAPSIGKGENVKLQSVVCVLANAEQPVLWMEGPLIYNVCRCLRCPHFHRGQFLAVTV